VSRIGVLAMVAVLAACSPADTSRTLTVVVTGYDSKQDMVEYRLVRHVRGGENNGHYEPVPDDPDAHRLPLASSAEILSVISLCSTGLTADSMGRANKTCTKDQLAQAVKDSVTPLAELQVDGSDQITRLAELYQP
jgi:hypothetical protein